MKYEEYSHKVNNLNNEISSIEKQLKSLNQRLEFLEKTKANLHDLVIENKEFQIKLPDLVNELAKVKNIDATQISTKIKSIEPINGNFAITGAIMMLEEKKTSTNDMNLGVFLEYNDHKKHTRFNYCLNNAISIDDIKDEEKYYKLLDVHHQKTPDRATTTTLYFKDWWDVKVNVDPFNNNMSEPQIADLRTAVVNCIKRNESKKDSNPVSGK